MRSLERITALLPWCSSVCLFVCLSVCPFIWDGRANISVFCFTCNQVWKWNKIISATEIVTKLFQNYLSVGKYPWAEIISANHSILPTHGIMMQLLPISDIRPRTYFLLKMQLLHLKSRPSNWVTQQCHRNDAEIKATTLTASHAHPLK